MPNPTDTGAPPEKKPALVPAMPERALRLDKMAGGAAEELFQNALAMVLDNLQDPNTDWKKKRQITLRIAFHTDEERRNAHCEIGCETRLAGIKPVPTIVHLGRHLGAAVAIEALRQEELFTEPHGRPRRLEDEGVEPR